MSWGIDYRTRQEMTFKFYPMVLYSIFSLQHDINVKSIQVDITIVGKLLDRTDSDSPWRARAIYNNYNIYYSGVCVYSCM